MCDSKRKESERLAYKGTFKSRRYCVDSYDTSIYNALVSDMEAFCLRVPGGNPGVVQGEEHDILPQGPSPKSSPCPPEQAYCKVEFQGRLALLKLYHMELILEAK